MFLSLARYILILLSNNMERKKMNTEMINCVMNSGAIFLKYEGWDPGEQIQLSSLFEERKDK